MILKRLTQFKFIVPKEIQQQYLDNSEWIKQADKHKLVVGSQARILYSDLEGRIAIAKAFNTAVAEGKLKVSLSFKKLFK